MSAVPNLPEGLVHPPPNNVEAAKIHIDKCVNSDWKIDHVEDSGHQQVNGVKPESKVWQLHDVPVENQRRMKVIIIGAGYSGVYCGIRIPERLRNCELVIYEKNAGIGGTWYENRYPGAACGRFSINLISHLASLLTW